MIKIRPLHMQNCTSNEYNKMIKEPSVTKNNIPDLPKPAIRFNGFNVYTNNGVVTVPATIYNTFAELGIKITDLVLQDTNSDTLKFDMNTLGKIVSTNMCMCIDNFILTLDNVYSVHINQMNENFKPIIDMILNNLSAEEDYKNHDYLKHFMFNASYHFINREDLARAIISYISIGPEARANMYNNIMSFAMSYINDAGISIYNALRNDITTLCEEKLVTKSGDEIVNTLFKFIENEFSTLMIDFTFEAGVFSNNIIENFDILFNPADFLAKNLNINVPDFTYPSKID